MNCKRCAGFKFQCVFVLLAMSLAPASYAASHTANGQAPAGPQIPTCAAIADAVKASYGAVSSFKDQTALLEKLTQPFYPLVRSCQIYTAGHKLPLNITFNKMSVKRVDKLEQVLKDQGRPARRVDMGWGHPVYLAVQNGTGAKAVVSVSAAVALHVTAHHASVKETKKMTRAVLDLM